MLLKRLKNERRIGVAKPTSISIETFGTAKVPMMEIKKFVNENFETMKLNLKKISGLCTDGAREVTNEKDIEGLLYI
jgi:hypothetical protein